MLTFEISYPRARTLIFLILGNHTYSILSCQYLANDTFVFSYSLHTRLQACSMFMEDSGIETFQDSVYFSEHFILHVQFLQILST